MIQHCGLIHRTADDGRESPRVHLVGCYIISCVSRPWSVTFSNHLCWKIVLGIYYSFSNISWHCFWSPHLISDCAPLLLCFLIGVCAHGVFSVSRNCQIALLPFSARNDGRVFWRLHYTSNAVLCPSLRRFRRLKRLNKVQDTFLKNTLLFYPHKYTRHLYRHVFFTLVYAGVIGWVFAVKNASNTRRKDAVCTYPYSHFTPEPYSHMSHI